MIGLDGTARRLLSSGAQLVLRTVAWLGGEVGAIAAERLSRHIPSSWLSASLKVARRGGIVYMLDLRDNTERTLFYTGFYDRALYRFLRGEIRRGDTYVDVGAHIGLYALPIARRLQRFGDGTVVAFEPASDTWTMLRHLAQLNHLHNVRVIQTALGATVARRPLRASEQRGTADAGTRSLYGDGVPTEVVVVRPFDDWVEERPMARLDVVKIDVEGGEYQVLQGMRASIARFKPRCIVVEVRASLLALAGVSPRELEALATALGYCPDGPGIGDVASGRHGHLGGNVVLRPCEQVRTARNRNRSPVSYAVALKLAGAVRSLRRRVTRTRISI
jgi:FkbM family methyltransferase